MTIWTYDVTVTDVDRLYRLVESTACVYCGQSLTLLKESVEKTRSEEEVLGPWRTIYRSSNTKRRLVNTCSQCGWWVVRLNTTSDWGIKTVKGLYGAVGTLVELDDIGQDQPIQEVLNYLSAKFDARFELDPFVLEDVVASVYKDLGYQSRVTGQSHDGGIDIVLDGPEDSTIGVQVKRYKSKISVEQIRAFVGALYLAGHHRGVFVTTSGFTSQAQTAARVSESQGIQMELLDARGFFEALGLAQRSAYQNVEEATAPFNKCELVYIDSELEMGHP